MATGIQIVNHALTILGSQGISSLDEEISRARQAKAIYDLTVEEVIRAHPWNCCVTRTTMAADVATPDGTDYTYQFSLPNDIVKVLQVGEYGLETDYRIEGRKLLSNEAGPLYLRYVYLNTDETTWDALLAETVTYSLAEKLAYALTGSPPLLQLISAKLKECRREARAVDGQDEPPEAFGDFPLIQVR